VIEFFVFTKTRPQGGVTNNCPCASPRKGFCMLTKNQIKSFSDLYVKEYARILTVEEATKLAHMFYALIKEVHDYADKNNKTRDNKNELGLVKK